MTTVTGAAHPVAEEHHALAAGRIVPCPVPPAGFRPHVERTREKENGLLL